MLRIVTLVSQNGYRGEGTLSILSVMDIAILVVNLPQLPGLNRNAISAIGPKDK